VFTDVEPLGQQGAMSYVQKARYDRQWVVVKRLLPQHRHNPMYKELFFKEYHNARDLSHEHIVDVQSRGEDAEGPYFFMEYVDGQSLSRLLLPAGIRDEKFIRRVATQTLEALRYAHKKQVFHRDLKPDNILITNRGDNVKLIDFGLAAADKFEDLAGAGFIGTKKYAAPEQSLDPSRVDGRADLYAFGLILLEMCTGSTDPAQLDRISSAALRNIAAKCLEQNPARRYADAGEVLEDLYAAPKPEARPAEPAAVPEGFRLLMNEFVLEWLPSDAPLPGHTVKLLQKQAASVGLPGTGLETELLDLRDLYRQVVSSGRVTPFARRSLLVQGQPLHVSEATIDQLLGQAVPLHGQNRPVPE
jgi:serine/threonine protein kinase